MVIWSFLSIREMKTWKPPKHQLEHQNDFWLFGISKKSQKTKKLMFLVLLGLGKSDRS